MIFSPSVGLLGLPNLRWITKAYFGGVAAVYQIQLLVLPKQAVDAIEAPGNLGPPGQLS